MGRIRQGAVRGGRPPRGAGAAAAPVPARRAPAQSGVRAGARTAAELRRRRVCTRQQRLRAAWPAARAHRRRAAAAGGVPTAQMGRSRRDSAARSSMGAERRPARRRGCHGMLHAQRAERCGNQPFRRTWRVALSTPPWSVCAVRQNKKIVFDFVFVPAYHARRLLG